MVRIDQFNLPWLMIVAFVVMFPSFALGLHIFPSKWTVNIHGTFQDSRLEKNKTWYNDHPDDGMVRIDQFNLPC
jgi:hypothetical protein